MQTGRPRGTLSSKHREAAEALAIAGFSPTEISEELGISKSHVYYLTRNIIRKKRERAKRRLAK